MNEIKCVGLIPAESEVDPKKGLNVLVMAINHADTEQTQTIRVFGDNDDQCKPMTEKSCTLAPKEHAHLYFHLPPRCFAAEFWNGEAPEELTLYAGSAQPETSGDLVFIK